MKLNEVTEGWGDALKSVASGFFQGATGIPPGAATNNKTNYIRDFVRRTNDKLRKAIGSGGVSAEPDYVTVVPGPSRPNEWRPGATPGSGSLTSGKTGQKYIRNPASGDWRMASAPGTNYPKDTPHAQALEKAMNDLVAGARDAAAGDMPDLSESMYRKLNVVFESILNEAAPLSISDFLLNQVKIAVPNLTSQQQSYAKKMCDSVQKAYANPAAFMAAFNDLGATVYSFVK